MPMFSVYFLESNLVTVVSLITYWRTWVLCLLGAITLKVKRDDSMVHLKAEIIWRNSHRQTRLLRMMVLFSTSHWYGIYVTFTLQWVLCLFGNEANAWVDLNVSQVKDKIYHLSGNRVYHVTCLTCLLNLGCHKSSQMKYGAEQLTWFEKTCVWFFCEMIKRTTYWTLKSIALSNSFE